MKLNQQSINKMSSKNPMWKGDKVGITALHEWVRSRLLRPKLCQDCNKVPPYDLANKGVYDRELRNWEWLCRKCHMTKDGRLHRLFQNTPNHNISSVERICKTCTTRFSVVPSKIAKGCGKFCSRSCRAKFLSKGWSKLYSKCIECKTTATRHIAKGLCSKCYEYKKYRQDAYELGLIEDRELNAEGGDSDDLRDTQR